jgi:hypothetical protein
VGQGIEVETVYLIRGRIQDAIVVLGIVLSGKLASSLRGRLTILMILFDLLAEAPGPGRSTRLEWPNVIQAEDFLAAAVGRSLGVVG